MGAFFIVTKRDGKDHLETIENLKASMALQGFKKPSAVFTTHNQTLYLFSKHLVQNVNYHKVSDTDFCAFTGTLLYKNMLGDDALASFYNDFSPNRVLYSKLYGAFFLIIFKENQLQLMVDPLGVYKVYTNSDGSVITSSFVASLSALKNPTIDKQGVYEYIFQGATYGNATLVKELSLLEGGFLYRLSNKLESIHKIKINADCHLNSDPDETFNDILAGLKEYYGSIAKCFGNNVDTALSGGYDSRLSLALLQDKGIHPNIHVYGGDNDPDVQVAKLIAQNEPNINLNHINKNQRPEISVNEFIATVKNNYYNFDGYPPDGIIDDGIDLTTREDRGANGNLMLNGGGGEIFRNFFYLPNKSLTIKELLWVFYSGFDPKTCTDRFNESTYHETLKNKIKQTLGITSDRLNRTEIELIYPMFRCRYWMGRTNSINNRFSYALTPFIEHSFIEKAAQIPIIDKYYGKFEARLINEISPTLAQYISAYGHNFSSPTPLRKIIAERLVYARPPILRKLTYRFKTRLRGERTRPYYLCNKYLESIVDINFPHMSKYFRVNKISDIEHLKRIITLEYLFSLQTSF